MPLPPFKTFVIGILLMTTVCDAAPSIESVSPGTGQRGSDFQIRLIGAGLADAVEVLFYSPGVLCTELKAVSDNELLIQIRAAAECLPGSYPFRVRTPQGISELRIFRITSFPVIAEVEPNNSSSNAQQVKQNVTMTGVLEEGDVDSFQVTLTKGDRLAAEAEAVRLGGNMLDTLLTVFGPDGQKIATVDDTALFRQDPFVTIVAPADGQYVVQIRSSNYEGDLNSRYALHVGTFPRPATVYPAGGPAGQLTIVRFSGDATGDFTQQVQLPSTPGPYPGLFAAQANLTAPTAIPFRVSRFANILEAEPNDEPRNVVTAAAQLPVAFNGIIERAHDRDGFRFLMPEGSRFQFEAFASQIGSPLDSVISIVDSEGLVLISNDDDGTHDSRLVFTAPYTGEYLLYVTDKRGEGGDQYVYRVEVTEPQPKLAAFLPRPNRLSQERQVIVVPKGNRVMAIVGTQRVGLEGTVRLDTIGLPAGVSFTETTVAADRYCVPVVFEALDNAALSGQLAEVIATADVRGKPVTGGFVQIVDLVGGSADTLFQSVEVNRLAVAVVEPSVFSISLDEPKSTLSQDGTIALKVHVERMAGFDGAIDITSPVLPAWVDGPEKITIPAGESTGVLTLHAFPQAEPRTWPFCIQAAPGKSAQSTESSTNAATPRRRGGSRSKSASATPVSSKLIALQVDKSPVTGTIGAVAAEQGKELTLVCQIKSPGRLPAKLTATLEGLPNRVSASPVTVSSNDHSVQFTVKLEATAPVGSFEDLVCRLAGTIDGDEVSYCVGRGGTLRIEPVGNLVIDDSGRPLSPLEVLRQSRKQTANGKTKAP